MELTKEVAMEAVQFMERRNYFTEQTVVEAVRKKFPLYSQTDELVKQLLNGFVSIGMLIPFDKGYKKTNIGGKQ